MSALSNIPPQAVLPLSAYDREDLRRAASRFDQVYLYADCSRSTDKESVLAAIADGFGLPDYFGHNLDALFDCITDLKALQRADKPGFVVVLEGLPDTADFGKTDRNALLDVFRDAADYFDDHDTAFRVFYSINRAAPGAAATVKAPKAVKGDVAVRAAGTGKA
ncbi:MAG: barstar family protein [Burkholderiaceae bacterium]